MLIIKIGWSTLQKELGSINPEVYEFVKKVSHLNQKTIIVIWGWLLCRFYQNALKDFDISDNNSLHYMWIDVINLNWHFLKRLLPFQNTYQQILYNQKNVQDFLKSEKKFAIFGASTPGHSSDYDAALAADFSSTKNILRITNVDYIYSHDPRVYADAKKFENLSWKQYLDIIWNPTTFEPWASYPIDPICARYCEKKNLSMQLTSLTNFLHDFEKFENFQDWTKVN